MFRLLRPIKRKFSHVATKKTFVFTPLQNLPQVQNISDSCKFCRGQGSYNCQECMGLTRIYEGEKEYRCDNCRGGIVECPFCGGSGKSHSIY